ncbi:MULTISPECIES: hypothetical protein [Roseateles]|uniref:Uncharacterized protein n=1 Tax=Roseateles albus TaxID=2987525 RepID=A0ABT5KFB6_9BURK|nr:MULTISPECIES: hypothetical protein [Roseateles]MCV2359424.1 hypothetical protein [Paucibacter sp. TC2R-5]MDC8771511.1 hypothetical protein [Roseateles albus]
MDAARRLTLPELEAALATMVHQRYFEAESDDEAELQAVEARDTEYLLTRIRCLELSLKAADEELSWIAPGGRSTPAQSLRRIKALCGRFPDLFNAMQAVVVTHPAVSREMLAMAIKQFRRDADALSQEDVVGLLTSVVNGANQAFDAVLRTRKGADRKAASLPWGKHTD